MTSPEGQDSVWRRPALVIALLGVFLGAIDLTVVATILPRMISDLGINTADLDRYIWVITGYLIAYIVSIPLFGRISDVVSVRATFVMALVLFVGGSYLCATATSLFDLLIGRVIQGAGGGAFLPVALSVATASFTGAARARAIGAVGAIDTLGWVSGPAYGAVVTTQFAAIEEPWRLVFWINIPIAGVLAAVAWRFLENPQIVSKGPAGRRGVTIAKLDLPGFLLLAIFLTAANLALASGGEIGATTGRGLRAFGGTPNPVAGYIPLLLAVAVISVALLALWTLKSRYPILPRQLFRLPRFRSSLGDNFLLGTALMAGMVNVPVIVSLAETSTDVATRSALLLAPFTGFIAAFSIISAQLLPRFGERAVIATGVILAVIGNLSIFPLLESFPYESMVIGLAIAGAGIGLALTPLSTAALDSASDDNRGSAASTLLIFRLLGMTVGVSALTALGVQRLQVLTGSLEGVAQRANESTAEFLLRQQQYVIDRAIPLGVQVIQETFLATALLVAIALIPMWRTGVRRQSESSRS